MRHKSMEGAPQIVGGTAGSQPVISGGRSGYNPLFGLVTEG
jgi:hypothetical protein